MILISNRLKINMTFQTATYGVKYMQNTGRLEVLNDDNQMGILVFTVYLLLMVIFDQLFIEAPKKILSRYYYYYYRGSRTEEQYETSAFATKSDTSIRYITVQLSTY